MKNTMRRTFPFVAVFLFAAMLFCRAGEAAGAESLIERIERDLGGDSAFTEDERALYAGEFRRRLAGYASDILSGGRERAADVLMGIVTEGSFDGAPVKRTVEVAVAAYLAIRRGGSPEAVEGIALYGFGKRLSPEKISAWAEGYADSVKFNVPARMAEDLVYNAAERGWDIHAYNTLKWGMVEAARAGYDMEDFHVYLLGHYLREGEKRPGGMVSRALRYFRRITSEKAEPELPEYLGSFIPRREAERKPAPDTAHPPGPGGVDKARKPLPEAEKRPVVSRILDKIERVYRSFLGAPYAWGGQTPGGTDCSGFVMAVFAEAGISLPRNSKEQWRVGRKVGYKELRKGDLVFFRTMGRRVSHVGIMDDAEKKTFIHASTSRGVSFASLEARYFRARYAGARRVIPATLARGGTPWGAEGRRD